MSTWAVWQVDRENPATRREIGELVLTEDGAIDVNSTSKEFLNFMSRIEADPLPEDHLVSPDELDTFVADLIMQRSDYRYVLEPLDGGDDQDDEEDDGQMPLYPPPPPPPKSSYSKVRRLGKD